MKNPINTPKSKTSTTLNITKAVIKNTKVNQMFDSASAKYIVSQLDSTSIELTELKPKRKTYITRTLKNPTTGEIIVQNIPDNTPELTDCVRHMSLEQFAKLVNNKYFEQTPFAYIEKHIGMGMEINKFAVKQEIKL
jgi:hypothetical protein